MSALDLRQGQTVWSKNIGGIRTPAIAGDFLFVITNENQVLCLKRDTGQVLWVQKLPLYVDEKTRIEKILWAGPILVNNQLVFASSQGKALFLFADSGKKASEFNLPGKTSLSPILVDKTLLFLTDEATLVAFR